MFWKVKSPTQGVKYQLVLHGEPLNSFAEEIEGLAQQLVYKHLHEKVSSKKWYVSIRFRRDRHGRMHSVSH